MTAYLQGAPAGAAPAVAAAPPLAIPPAPLVAGPMPPPTMTAAHPDSNGSQPGMATASKPAVTFSAVQPATAPPHLAPKPPSRPVAAASSAAPVVAVASAPLDTPPAVLAQLVRLVSDRTGYPEDMLDVDANIEADLGIDSIKRIEILTAFQQAHAGAERGAFQNAMEKLTAIKTLRETASVLTELLAVRPEAAIA
jgi:hypothetical protein